MIMSTGKVNRALACAFFGLTLCAAPVFAQRVQRAPNRKAPATRKMQPAQYVPNRYILFLADEPVLSRFAAHDQLQTAAAVSYRQQIETRQQSVMQELTTRQFQVAGAVSTVANAIFVVASPDRLPELRSIAGVVGVMPERAIKPSLNKATTLANAPAAWAQSAIGGQSNAGNGIKIGVIDTGIDPNNPALSDSGFSAPSGFPKCDSYNSAKCSSYTNKKVIVARSYIQMVSAGSNGAANSIPDDYTPRDHDGHGTGVATSAAGVQNSAGAVPFSGMAPKAYVGSYKIFSNDLVTDTAPESVIIQALHDAVSDGMDIINLSAGGAAFTGALDDVQCGNAKGVPCDPLANAFETAAKAGTVIVVAAGNSGDYSYQFSENYPYFNGISSPGTAPSVITVGGTVNSHIFGPAVSVNGSAAPASLKYIAAAWSDSFISPSTNGGNSAPLIDVTTLGDNGQACSALPAGSLGNSFALIQRSPTGTGCTFDTKAVNASNAGAIGIVFYMADSTAPIQPGGICYSNANGTCDLIGPGVMISLAAGQALKTYIDANPGAKVTIDFAGIEQALDASVVNTLLSFSSDGPTPDGLIKPDMVATGGYDDGDINPNDVQFTSGIYTAGQSYDPNGGMYTTSGFVAVDGTSFATPLVAGAAAMVKQAHPTWTVAQIKSALVNNSAQDVTMDDLGDSLDVEWIGAGRLDANGAVSATVTAVPSTLSFGYLKSGTALPSPIAVTLTNAGASSVTLTVAVVPGINTTSAATVTTDQKSLTIAAGKTATLNVTLGGTVPAGGEYSGMVTLTSSSPAVSLHLPYMFLVGDGSFPNVVPAYGNEYYGAVGQDLGAAPIQVIDSWGVPVSGATVTFSVTQRGAVTLKPVPGVPGSSTGTTIPFVPSNCTPATSGTSVSCTTNNYGIAWIEIVAGSTAYDINTNPVTINVASQGQTVTIYVGILPTPTITAVADAGAYGTTIAPGSYVALFGTNLADPDLLTNSAGDLANLAFTDRLPLTWDADSVSFDAPASGSLPAISIPAYMYFISTGQVNIYVPWELENYPSVQMKVILNGFALGEVFSNVITVPVNNYTPAFLGFSSGSVYMADAVDAVNCPAPYKIGPTCSATRGQPISLYVNGLGPVSPQPNSGDPAPSSEPLARTTTQPVVMIGGQSAQVLYSGLAPGFVGEYQVNVIVPSGIGTGNQPITIAIGGKTSPSAISTANIVIPVR